MNRVGKEEKYQADSRITEQTVLIAELESLKPNKKVYVQQENSFVFFKSDIRSTLSDCKKNLKQLEKVN